MKIGVTIVATNSYFPLGIRLIKRFAQFYKGNAEITFYIFTDTNPKDYLPDNINCVYIHREHKQWVDGTNSKFQNILDIADLLINEDYVMQLDADTNVSREFTEDWFIGDRVGGQHYGDIGYVEKPFDRHILSMAYIPKDTPYPQTYYYGAFFSFSYKELIEFCETLIKWQKYDKEKLNYEPVWNDESYINKYFHYNPPKTILCKDFPFIVSDKGGIGETRNTNLDVNSLKADLRKYRDMLIDIKNGKVCV